MLDWKGLLAVAGAALLSWFLPREPDDPFAIVMVSIAVLFGVAALLEQRTRSRHLRNLREILPEDRTRYLDHVTDFAYRAMLQRDLADDLRSYVGGEIERFGFAPVLKRAASTQYWLLVCSIAVMLVCCRYIPLPAPGGLAVLCLISVCGFVGLQLLNRWRQYLDTWLEVSRFGISEVWPNGTRRTLLWNQRLWLDNQPRRRRLQVLIADKSDGIAIHYRRTNSVRAYRLVVEYGGFQELPPAA